MGILQRSEMISKNIAFSKKADLFYRVPDEQLGYIFLNLTMGQVVSLIFILSGVILFYLKHETR